MPTITIEIDPPRVLDRGRFMLNEKVIMEAVAAKMLEIETRKISAGLLGDGTPAPQPRRGNKPLNLTGELAAGLAARRTGKAKAEAKARRKRDKNKLAKLVSLGRQPFGLTDADEQEIIATILSVLEVELET